MKLLPLLLALSLSACAGVHESEWNYAPPRNGVLLKRWKHQHRSAHPLVVVRCPVDGCVECKVTTSYYAECK